MLACKCQGRAVRRDSESKLWTMGDRLSVLSSMEDVIITVRETQPIYMRDYAGHVPPPQSHKIPSFLPKKPRSDIFISTVFCIGRHR